MLCEACHQGIAKEIVKGIAAEVWVEFKWYIISAAILISTSLFFILRFLSHHIKIYG